MPIFPSQHRLTRPEEFEAVKAKGTSVRTKLFLFSALRGEHARLGLVVSKKVGNAVVRNRLKRLAREDFRLRSAEYPNADCVLVFFKEAADVDSKNIFAALAEARKKISKKLA
ncbi:MAG: ribonuclease P protein component [Deltaproteobacteria bacterium CG_4_10_14_0_2_um_filter_43_8]|nr:MAG: ribonuclease P protein component [Deltaproteobacteria bacterium CG11_big_fil_rev_8_21_14_0_20_42_23]PJA19249.1 MAG: ribonuclease P protein component [Deltaproteobacteria bacterium CG_4_10_14_0_2_um_filter_43_8]PJC64124.1 MAG: ribonuclease P protein component [Deltaproteobacteria bacterium CG_4_9_14_0_2_um_filter_42_21]